MTEVLNVEVDGEVDDEGQAAPGDGSPTWGLPVAIATAGVLLLAVLVMVVLPALTGSPTRSESEAGARRQLGTAQRATPGSEPVDLRIDAAGRALDAWGQFAASGDLGVLHGFFDRNGPQYRVLAEEAPRLSGLGGGRTPYRVSLSSADVVLNDEGQAVVKGKVTWARSEEADQVHSWEIVLRRAQDERWLLWTVRNR